MPLRRYRSFSTRCHTGSSLQDEKTLTEEHFVRVMSVMTVPAWWVGRCVCRASGRTRKLRSRKKMTIRVKTAAVAVCTIVRT